MKKNILDRFYLAINYIISNKIADSKGEISEIFGITNSKFSEILKKRMNPGIELFSVLIEHYNIDAYWLLLGKGDMLNVAKQEFVQQCQNCKAKESTIVLQQKLIVSLEENLAHLRQKCGISGDAHLKKQKRAV